MQDLNAKLQHDMPDDWIDAVCMCDGLAYLTQPIAVLKEALRVLRPGAPLIITFSANFHAAKATAMWQALVPEDLRSVARRVWKECRSRRSPYH